MAATLEKTIESVVGQSYPNMDYVIIDGGSDDGSVDIIREHAETVSYWISERDRNLYDAMNKGVKAAVGDWILFMNSGDQFCDSNVLSDVFDADHSDADVIYGDWIWNYRDLGFSRQFHALVPAVTEFGMNCSHQALFARKVLLEAHPFRLDIICADYEFLLASKLSGKHFRIIPRNICIGLAGGLSDRSRFQSLWDHWSVLWQYRIVTPRVAFFYAWYAAKALVGQAVRIVLPRQWSARLLKRKDRLLGVSYSKK